MASVSFLVADMVLLNLSLRQKDLTDSIYYIAINN